MRDSDALGDRDTHRHLHTHGHRHCAAGLHGNLSALSLNLLMALGSNSHGGNSGRSDGNGGNSSWSDGNGRNSSRGNSSGSNYSGNSNRSHRTSNTTHSTTKSKSGSVNEELRISLGVGLTLSDPGWDDRGVQT